MTPQLAEALRAEIRAALDADGKPFDVNVARRVYDLAIAAKDMCVAATSGVKEAIDQIKDTNGPIESLDSPDTPESQVQASESFGARLLRELMATLPLLQQRRDSDDPKQLVHALAEARRNGMHDVAEELEKKLFGRVLLGSRPISIADGVEVVVGGYEHGFADGRTNAPAASLNSEYAEGYKDGTQTRLLETNEPTTVKSSANNTDVVHASNCLARLYDESRECNCHRSKRLADDGNVLRYDDTEQRGRPSNRLPMDPIEREELEGK